MFPEIYKKVMEALREERKFRIALSVLAVLFFMNPTTWDMSLEKIRTEGMSGISATAIKRALPYFSFLVGGIASGIAIWFKTYIPFPVLFVFGTVKTVLTGNFIELFAYYVLLIILMAVFVKIRKKHEEEYKIEEIKRRNTPKEAIKEDLIYRNPDKIPKDIDSRFTDF